MTDTLEVNITVRAAADEKFVPRSTKTERNERFLLPVGSRSLLSDLKCIHGAILSHPEVIIRNQGRLNRDEFLGNICLSFPQKNFDFESHERTIAVQT